MWQAALELDCSIQSDNDMTIWRDNHPSFDNLWAQEFITIPQHSDSHGLAVENGCDVHILQPIQLCLWRPMLRLGPVHWIHVSVKRTPLRNAAPRQHFAWTSSVLSLGQRSEPRGWRMENFQITCLGYLEHHNTIGSTVQC